MHSTTPIVRLILIGACLLMLASAALLPAVPRVAARQELPRRGLVAVAEPSARVPVVTLEHAERFRLQVDEGGLRAWFDLGGDRERNLAAPGLPLLVHSSNTGERFSGRPMLVEVSPVRAVVRIDGRAGPAVAMVRYTIWAGGQIAIETHGPGATNTSLQFDPAASVGAALRPAVVLAAAEGSGPVTRSMLYLGAWTPDAAPDTADGAVRFVSALDDAGPAAARALDLELPAGVLRQPRMVVAGWPGAAHGLSLAGTPLVEGVDYLAHWDEARGELQLQYLGLLPPGDRAGRTFRLSPTQEPALALEILNQSGSAPRQLTPDGLLQVDANLPSSTGAAPGTITTNDIFAIPYIQTWPELRLRATLSATPVGLSGVRFTVSGPGFSQSVDDTDGSDGYSTTINLPRRAEYSLVATALVDGQPAAPSRAIAQVAYGRVFVSIGDSITAGKWGFYRRPGEDGYPFTAPPPSGGSYPVSADGRNYPQSDNSNDDLAGGTPTYENTYYQGYQVELNGALAACLNAPVFVLNSGISGIRTGRDSYKSSGSSGVGTAGEANVLGKGAAYRSQLSQLGAEHVLLQIGTNDAATVNSSTNQLFNEPMPASLYNQDLRSVINALRQQNSAVGVWVARLPWRDDRRSDDPEIVREERRAKVQEFNLEISSIVDELGASQPVYRGPDLYTTFTDGVNQGLLAATDPTSGSADRLHPTAAGYTLMAQQWASAICAVLPAEPDPGDPGDPGEPGCGEPGGPPCPEPPTERIYLPLLRATGASTAHQRAPWRT